MSDSADISNAAKRLQTALAVLEDNLDPILSKVGRLEKDIEGAKVFQEDRARLATELDEAKAQSETQAAHIKTFSAREAEFNRLAGLTTKEIERVIGEIESALSRAGG